MIGERIRQARLAAGMSQDDVVEELARLGCEITKAAISKYENNKSEPKQRVVVALSRALGVKPSYFFEESTVEIEWLAFRKQASFPKRRQEEVKAFAKDVVEGQAWLQATLYPREQATFPKPRRATAPKDAEKAAARLREEWGLDDSPIDSLIEMVEDHGGFVVGFTNPGVKFDGLSGRLDERPVVIVNLNNAVDRRRYNVAHELGHLQMDCRDLSAKEEERLAHRFAAALLVPEGVARRELGARRRNLSIEELGVLKLKYGLSMQAWIRRALDLEIISEKACKGLCIDFSRRGWRKQEPVDFEGHEVPFRLVQMTLRALSEGVITPDQAERLCQGAARDPVGLMQRVGEQKRSPRELLRMPMERRRRILQTAAAKAESEYRRNRDLTDYEAHGEEDFHDYES